MRVAMLPGKLVPGMQLFPPLMANTLGGAPGGLDPGLPQVGIIAFRQLAALAACTVASQGAEMPVLLLFVGGQRRPVMVEATRVRAAELGVGGPPHRPENLRTLILHLARLAPHLVVDSATFDFLQGRMLLSRSGRIGDLADAIGLILVQGQEMREVELPGSPAMTTPARAAPQPPAPPPPAPPPPAPPPPAPPPPAATPPASPQPASTASATLWLHPESRVLAAFPRGSIVLAGVNAEQAAACAHQIHAGVHPRQVLGPQAAEIPSSAVRRVRRDPASRAIQLEYQTDDGLRTASIPYGHEAAGQALYEALRRHLTP